MEMLCKVVAIVFSFGALVLCVNPGVRIQMSTTGLNYAKTIGIQMLNEELPGMHFPDISSKQRSLEYSYKLKNITLTEFNIPNNQAEVALHPSNTLVFSASGLSAKVTAEYHVKVSAWMLVGADGDMVVRAEKANFNQELTITENNMKPHMTAGKCSAAIGILHVKFDGDMLDSVLNALELEITEYIKGHLNDIICGRLSSLINVKANGVLNEIPTSKSIGHGFNIDYSLTSDPFFHGSKDIIVPMKAKVWYKGHHNDPTGTKPLPMSPILPSNKMLCLQLSPVNVFNSLGYALQTSGILQYTLSKEILEKFKISKFMACSCAADEKCIGSFIPEIASKCPMGGTVELAVSSTVSPHVAYNTSGMYLGFAGSLDFNARLLDDSVVDLFTADVFFSAVIPSTHFELDGWSVKGKCYVTSTAMTVKQSNLENLDQCGLKQMWQLAALAVVIGGVNQFTQMGIPLPHFPGVEILEPELTAGSHEIQICANVHYTGSLKK